MTQLAAQTVLSGWARVLGGACSNHSVPTILFNDLAELLPVRLFRA